MPKLRYSALTPPRLSAAETMTLKIDVFNHIFPRPFFERLQKVIVNRGPIKRWLNIPFLHDLDVRFRMLEEFGSEYRQILSLSAPPIEAINPDRQITIDLARLANDSMADLVRAHPERFAGFVASLPLSDAEASAAEFERADRARRDRRAAVLEREWTAARRRALPAAVRRVGPPEGADSAAPGESRDGPGLSRRAQIEI
jgi:predicted TIM-barrel fold metal-dependent hydrolase